MGKISDLFFQRGVSVESVETITQIIREINTAIGKALLDAEDSSSIDFFQDVGNITFQEELEGFKNNLDQFAEVISSRTAQLTTMNSQISDVSGELTRMAEKKLQLEGQIVQLTDKQASKQLILSDTINSLQKAQSDWTKQQFKLEMLQNQVKDNAAKIEKQRTQLTDIQKSIEFYTKKTSKKQDYSATQLTKLPDFLKYYSEYKQNPDLERFMKNISEDYWKGPANNRLVPAFDHDNFDIFNYSIDELVVECQGEFDSIIEYSSIKIWGTKEFVGSMIQYFNKFLNHEGYRLSVYPEKYVAFLRYTFMDFLVDHLLGKPIWKDVFQNKTTTLRDILHLIYEVDGAEGISQYRYLCFIASWQFKMGNFYKYKTLQELLDILRPKMDITVTEDKIMRFSKEKASDNLETRYTPRQIDGFSGYEFEELLNCLFAAMGYVVKKTKKTGDQGADLVAIKSGEKIVVQAKRYKGSVGNHAIQEVIGSREYYNADKAIVACMSSYTSSATSLALSADVELWNRKQVLLYVEKYLNSTQK